MTNMGTPNHPEGVPHWDWKSLIAFKIKKAWELAQGYVPPGPNTIGRRMMGTILQSPLVDEGISKMGGGMIGQHWSDTNPFWYIAADEQPHDNCEGGTAVVDVVGLMGHGGEVKVESPWCDYIVDIGIYNGRKELVPTIEVVDTSHVSPQKISKFKQEGVEGYIFNVRGIPKGNEKATLNYSPMLMQPVGYRRCGSNERAIVKRIIEYWDSKCSQHPALTQFIGVQRWEGTLTHQYIYGVTIDPRNQNEQALSELNTMSKSPIDGMVGDSLNWGKPMEILPDSPRRSLAVNEWLDALALMRVYGAAMYAQGVELPNIYKQICSPQGMELMAFARIGARPNGIR